MNTDKDKQLICVHPCLSVAHLPFSVACYITVLSSPRVGPIIKATTGDMSGGVGVGMNALATEEPGTAWEIAVSP